MARISKMTKILISTDIKAELCQKYENGISINSLACEYKIDRHRIGDIIKILGIKREYVILNDKNQKLKYCRGCKQHKLFDEFFINNQNKAHSCSTTCKKCSISNYIIKAKANPIENQARQFRHRSKLRSKKITVKITEQLLINTLKKQEYRCVICKTHQKELRKRLCIDHNHTTGVFRGMLCDRCNKVIGNFYEDIESIKRAIIYLENTIKQSQIESLIEIDIKSITRQIKYWNKHFGIKEQITTSIYISLLKHQNNKCAICYKKYPRNLAIDHNHINGKIRGLLCHHCNRAFGNIRDDIMILKNMIDYLRKEYE